MARHSPAPTKVLFVIEFAIPTLRFGLAKPGLTVMRDKYF